MNQLRHYLTSIYGKEVLDHLMTSIGELKEKYARNIESSSKLTESDVCLIMYADQVYETDGDKLASATKFVTEELPFISTVHLLPFYPYSSDDGFSVIDYFEVMPKAGNWDDVERLSSHKRLMFDAVINHVSQESTWFKEFLNGNPKYSEFFVEESPAADLSSVTRPRTSPLLHEFEAADGRSKHIWTTFSRDQVDWNYKNPEVFLLILEVLMFYMSKGARLLRLDAIGFMWKQIGTNCIHLEETHTLIKCFRSILKSIDPEVVLITETNVPHLENISYFGDGDEADMVYNFTLPPLLALSLLSETTTKLTDWAMSLELPSDNVCFFNFTASHDGVGVRPLQGIVNAEELNVLIESAEANGGLISYKKNEDGSESPYEINCNYLSLLKGSKHDEYGLRRFILSQVIALSMPGLPAIYFHSLIGSENDREGVKRTGMKRTINREKLRLNDLLLEINTNQTRNTVFTELKTIIEKRNALRAFNPFGQFKFLNLPDGLFGVKRFYEDQTVIAVFNLTSSTMKTKLVGVVGEDVISGIECNDLIELKPFSFAWVLLHAHLETV